jgi:hypothetical protein
MMQQEDKEKRNETYVLTYIILKPKLALKRFYVKSLTFVMPFT